MAVYLSSGVMMNAPGWIVSEINIAPALPRIECGRIADMANYTHTIDRWDGDRRDLIELWAKVGDGMRR
jgi:hypothetical protein